MTWWQLLLLSAGFVVFASAAVAAVLAAGGRRSHARAVAGFIPDCAVLIARLARDGRIPRRHRVALLALGGYLALPFDLVPDFVPVLGQLDDALLVALVLRRLVRAGGTDLVRAHWPGPEPSLRLVLRLAA